MKITPPTPVCEHGQLQFSGLRPAAAVELLLLALARRDARRRRRGGRRAPAAASARPGGASGGSPSRGSRPARRRPRSRRGARPGVSRLIAFCTACGFGFDETVPSFFSAPASSGFCRSIAAVRDAREEAAEEADPRERAITGRRSAPFRNRPSRRAGRATRTTPMMRAGSRATTWRWMLPARGEHDRHHHDRETRRPRSSLRSTRRGSRPGTGWSCGRACVQVPGR